MTFNQVVFRNCQTGRAYPRTGRQIKGNSNENFLDMSLSVTFLSHSIEKVRFCLCEYCDFMIFLKANDCCRDHESQIQRIEQFDSDLANRQQVLEVQNFCNKNEPFWSKAKLFILSFSGRKPKSNQFLFTFLARFELFFEPIYKYITLILIASCFKRKNN